MSRVFARAYAPSALGSFLRTFTFGHVRQLDAFASRFLIALAGLTRPQRRGAGVGHRADGQGSQEGDRRDRSGRVWTSIECTDALFDETTGRWISRAEVAEVAFTAFTSAKKSEQVSGRLVVRRIPIPGKRLSCSRTA